MKNSNELGEAIAERDRAEIRRLILQTDFIVISVDTDETEESVAPLTAEIQDFEVLMAFTSEQTAGRFVDAMSELFSEEEEVEGTLVEGATLLESLPEGFGLLLDAESDHAGLIDPALAKELTSP